MSVRCDQRSNFNRSERAFSIDLPCPARHQGGSFVRLSRVAIASYLLASERNTPTLQPRDNPSSLPFPSNPPTSHSTYASPPPQVTMGLLDDAASVISARTSHSRRSRTHRASGSGRSSHGGTSSHHHREHRSDHRGRSRSRSRHRSSKSTVGAAAAAAGIAQSIFGGGAAHHGEDHDHGYGYDHDSDHHHTQRRRSGSKHRGEEAARGFFGLPTLGRGGGFFGGFGMSPLSSVVFPVVVVGCGMEWCVLTWLVW